MITYEKLEHQIEQQVKILLQEEDDCIIIDNILTQIATQNNLKIKDLKRLLYQNESYLYGISGYIDGNKISIQNLIITFKRVTKKIFKKIESALDYKLETDEKLKIISYIEYNLLQPKEI